MSKTVKVILSVVGVMVLMVITLLGVGAYFVYSKLTEGAVSQQTYDSIQVGQRQADVLGRLPEKQSELAKLDIENENPPPPARPAATT
jgi:predicted negative regulator of RcsB-dependent stress response